MKNKENQTTFNKEVEYESENQESKKVDNKDKRREAEKNQKNQSGKQKLTLTLNDIV